MSVDSLEKTNLPPPFPPGRVGPQSSKPRPVKILSFTQVLLTEGLLTPEQLTGARQTASREKLSLGRVLARDGLVASRDLATLYAIHMGLTMVELHNQVIDREAIALIPEPLARKYLVLPLKKDAERLTVAMVDPTDFQLIQDLTARTGCKIDQVVSVTEDILEHIDITYRLTEGTTEQEARVKGALGGKVTASVLLDSPPAQVIELLLHQALQDRASDIHLEPSETRLRVRFRIDGLLHDVMGLPLEMHPPLLSRLKIMSGMNIAERRRSQDGQFTAQVENRGVDVRVATGSTTMGEMAVLRLLDKRFTLLGLDQIGMTPETLESYRRILRLPYGMVIVCGPTGAGKSTTLYASILEMNRTEVNVISLEDPVEYRILDTNQMQMQGDAGITFATQLRSVLRLDPDVIMVGEIRDQETAIIATQAALTGHLVLTSLHANDSISALIRLRDLGVAPYLISSSVAGIVSQRMVRQICGGCKTLMERPEAERMAYAADMGETQESFIYGSGCNLCAQTGYRGRTGVFELLTMSDSIRQLFLTDAPRSQLSDEALKEGMRPMRREGMLKVKEGITTPHEVMRVLFSLD